MSVEIAKVREFIKHLADLLSAEQQESFDPREWEANVRKFINLIRGDRQMIELMNEELWHFTADLGIRMKDEEYAKRQRKFVSEYLRSLGDYGDSDYGDSALN
jgi:hypothetical protein